jgi:hypothetical protein
MCDGLCNKVGNRKHKNCNFNYSISVRDLRDKLDDIKDSCSDHIDYLVKMKKRVKIMVDDFTVKMDKLMS